MSRKAPINNRFGESSASGFLASYQYELPERLIAQSPADQRDESRLLHLDRATGRTSHHVFRGLPSLLRPGDLLVVNDTRVVPARFFCRRETGASVEGLYLHADAGAPGAWQVLLKNANRCKVGEELQFVDSDRRLRLLDRLGQGRWRVRPEPAAPAEEILDVLGVPPLPPYIRRDPQEARPADRQRYQTVYADRPGAVAAPTAGLHFTPELLGRLTEMDVQQVCVTLHVGLGTFAPVKADDLSQHDMHSEWYEIRPEVASAVLAARAERRRVIAVGTTSVRVLESAARAEPDPQRLARDGATGWTDLFLYPPADFALTDVLITNFHLPGSTLLMLVSAFCDPGGTSGIGTILSAYQAAITNDYRFYSYGDAMLIE